MPLEFDNQRIDITGTWQLNFAKAMAFFFVRERDMVLSSAISPDRGLVLFWCIPDNVVRTEWNSEKLNKLWQIKGINQRLAPSITWNGC